MDILRAAVETHGLAFASEPKGIFQYLEAELKSFGTHLTAAQIQAEIAPDYTATDGDITLAFKKVAKQYEVTVTLYAWSGSTSQFTSPNLSAQQQITVGYCEDGRCVSLKEQEMRMLSKLLADQGLQPVSKEAASLFHCLKEPLKMEPLIILTNLVRHGMTNPMGAKSGNHYGQNLPGGDSADEKWKAWLKSLKVDSLVPTWFLQLVAERFKCHIKLYQTGTTPFPVQFVPKNCQKNLDLGYVNEEGYLLLKKRVPNLTLDPRGEGSCIFVTDLTQNNQDDLQITGNLMAALLNSEGGTIVVRHIDGEIASTHKQAQNWISRMEDFILAKENFNKHGIPPHIFRKHVRVEQSSLKQICYTIGRSTQCITKDYRAYYRTATACRKIDDYQIMAELLKLQQRKPAMKCEQNGCRENNKRCPCGPASVGCYTDCEDFVYDKPPLKTEKRETLLESERCEFKYYYALTYDAMVNDIFHPKKKNQSILKNTISAFANSDGGTIYIGIEETDEKPPIVKGQRLDATEFDICKGQMVPKLDNYYVLGTTRTTDIFHLNEDDMHFLRVSCDNNNDRCSRDDLCPCKGSRHVIAVVVHKFHGVVFVQHPIFYRVDSQGNVTCRNSLDEWKDRVLALDASLSGI